MCTSNHHRETLKGQSECFSQVLHTSITQNELGTVPKSCQAANGFSINSTSITFSQSALPKFINSSSLADKALSCFPAWQIRSSLISAGSSAPTKVLYSKSSHSLLHLEYRSRVLQIPGTLIFRNPCLILVIRLLSCKVSCNFL